jgi:hypothetical protein
MTRSSVTKVVPLSEGNFLEIKVEAVLSVKSGNQDMSISTTLPHHQDHKLQRQYTSLPQVTTWLAKTSSLEDPHDK